MSSKRRKVIASERPSNPRSILTDSVRAALRQQPNPSGVATAALAAIEQTFASTPATFEPQGPLEQTLRTMVRNRVQRDADYDPERFPNIDKWSANKK